QIHFDWNKFLGRYSQTSNELKKVN
ncbi:MAG: hypothetical protein ACI86H_002390, partial [bacterium]